MRQAILHASHMFLVTWGDHAFYLPKISPLQT